MVGDKVSLRGLRGLQAISELWLLLRMKMESAKKGCEQRSDIIQPWDFESYHASCQADKILKAITIVTGLIRDCGSGVKMEEIAVFQVKDTFKRKSATLVTT